MSLLRTVQFGSRIRELRKNKGLSQENLAELTGFHRTYIGMIERGERNPALILKFSLRFLRSVWRSCLSLPRVQ